MRTLLQRIQIGIGAGAALAVTSAASSGCGLSTENAPPDASTDGALMLTPYSLDNLSCDSSDAGTFCCYSAQCFVGLDDCVAPEDRAEPIPTSGCDVTGPFAPNPEDLNAQAGDCCYIVGSQAAVGRPLFDADAWLLAPVVARSDWSAV